jgi:hypothetical protein
MLGVGIALFTKNMRDAIGLILILMAFLLPLLSILDAVERK